MNIAAIDALQGRIQRIGGASGLPKNMTQEQLIDELQRQLGALGDVCKALLQELRAGPRYSKDASLFKVDCRTATSNILSTAQANLEGLGATAGLAIYRHGLGYKLDRANLVWVSDTMTVAGTNNAHHGTCALYAFDDDRTVFQVDQDAQTNHTVFVFSCYASLAPPSGLVNKGQQTKTGSSTPQLGTIIANTLAGGLP